MTLVTLVTLVLAFFINPIGASKIEPGKEISNPTSPRHLSSRGTSTPVIVTSLTAQLYPCRTSAHKIPAEGISFDLGDFGVSFFAIAAGS